MIVIKTFNNINDAVAWASIHHYKDVNRLAKELQGGHKAQRDNIIFKVKNVV